MFSKPNDEIPSLKSIIKRSGFTSMTFGTFRLWSLQMIIFNLIDALFYDRWFGGTINVVKFDEDRYQWDEVYTGLNGKSTGFTEYITLDQLQSKFDEMPKFINAHNPVFVTTTDVAFEHVGTIFQVCKANLKEKCETVPQLSAADKLSLLRSRRNKT